MKKFSTTGKFLAVASAVGFTMANAALDAPTIDTADFETVAGAVLVAAGVFYGIRKALRLIG